VDEVRFQNNNNENTNIEKTPENLNENVNITNNHNNKNNNNINNNINHNINLYDNNKSYKMNLYNTDEDDEDEDEFFFTFTGLDQEHFQTFVRDLYEFKQEHKKIRWNLIETMCSAYSYLKLFMDRILDSVFKEIYIDLLLPFKEGGFIQELDKLFISMSDENLLKLMEINEETQSRLQEIENLIQNLEEASRNIDGVNRRIVHRPSRMLLNNNYK